MPAEEEPTGHVDQPSRNSQVWASSWTRGGAGRGEPKWAQGQTQRAQRQRKEEMECTSKLTWSQLALMSCGVRSERAGWHVGEEHISLQEGWGEPSPVGEACPVSP